MGTDVHSDYKASEKEMQRRRQKWEKTTASTLGVRLIGMKVGGPYNLDNYWYLHVQSYLS